MMAFELILNTSILLESLLQGKIITCFENRLRLYTVEKEISGLQSEYAYSMHPERREQWPEDFRIFLKEKEVGLAFYSTTDQQQARITQLLLECLQQNGVEGNFEEP